MPARESSEPRPIVYALEPGEYELRIYGACPSCDTCVVALRTETASTLTITPRPGATIDLTTRQPEG